MTSFHEADQTKAEADADHSAFMSWKPGTPVPERLTGRARSPRPGLKFLESVGQPLYGRMGETVTDGVLFHGEPFQTWPLGIDGVLTVPGDAAALFWLFQDGRPLLMKRAPGAAPSLDAEAEQLLVEAFDPIVMA